MAAGFAAGAVMGVLFAPDKGEVTRSRVRNKASELGEEMAEKYDEEIERLQKRISQLKERFADEVVKNVKGDVDVDQEKA